ncbi:Na/Pi cotransporter family protein [Motiliproteus coralliicola]|uniref:Na/Pi cotransporter family protein n=1 Tax=Motiliproteus coralliicola TaxID=2283196 RepID=A0A369WN67_9GAMM|nr:Na/Pi symporter [Motiliproteus coralliicola]RDE22663.1 Na/Pi cotransporter family protein [Motiliproteus coralliicola]
MADSSLLEQFPGLIQSLGGLGLFLLGMVIMTSGLKALAGERLRDWLMRSTRTPTSGALVGACCTALLQSSSATTVAAVGFVAAELMSFSHALGIIFGANLGTTITGWLVALLGFKLKLSTLAFPLIFIGTMLKLFGRGRLAEGGLALAGFALIFIGIQQLQLGMTGLQQLFSFEQLPADTLGGRLQLVLLGIAFTLVTQSSSAGVATTLTALHSGFIGFEQAAALVIGMDIGTTVTALMATLGGSVGSRRTGYSHVIYNLLTGVMALLLIGPFVWLCGQIDPQLPQQQAELSLVAFHSSFNLIGVLLILPFSRQFAELLQRLVPDRAPRYTGNLDPILLEQPELALNAVQLSLDRQLAALTGHTNALLGDPQCQRVELAPLQRALDDTHQFIDQIHLQPSSSLNWQRLVAMIHSLDHMQRLHERCEEEEDRASCARVSPDLEQVRLGLIDSNRTILDAIAQRRWQPAEVASRQTRAEVETLAPPQRDRIANAIGHGQLNVPQGTDQLEALRWLRRVSHHLCRISHHQHQAALSSGSTIPRSIGRS